MCTKCQDNNCGCSKTTVEYKKCKCAPEAPCECAVKDLSTDCSVYQGDNLECSGIVKGTILTELIQQLDAFICAIRDQLINSLSLINIGTGAKIYKGVDGIGRKEIRTIVSTETVTVTENTNDISLDVNLDNIPLELIDQGNGNGIVIRNRNQDNYLPVGNGALDLSYSGNAFPLSGASGTHSFTGNSKTIASAEDSTAFNSAEVTEQGSFAINESTNSAFYGFSWGSGDARGTNTMAGGVSCIADQQGSTATGTSTKATGFSSDAIGQETEALAPISSASGHLSKTRGNVSHAGGQSNETDSHGETAIGTYGTIQAGNPSDVAFVPTDRIFNIGNGFIDGLTSIVTRSNAFTILKNGLATLPSVTNALIAAGSVKSVITKEYLTSVIALIDGSETKVTAGTNVTVTGTGTSGNPYIINSTASPTTTIANGTTTIVTGDGSGGNPYKVETVNLQKPITADYLITSADNNYSIKVNNGSTPITITVPSGLPENFFVGFTQKGTGDVTFVGSGTTITNPIGLKIKGQGYCVGLEQIGTSNSFDLLADTKA